MNNTTKESKVRPTLRVDPKTAQRVEQWYKAANCRSQNEFMERAINFYADYIEMNDNNDLLPQALQSYLDGRLSQLESRLSTISFDCLVGLDELTGIIADYFEFTEDELRLSFRRRTRIGNQLYIFTGADVLEIATGVARVFDVGTFQNQLYH